MAKRLATDTGFEVVNGCLQLHGGYGYLRDHPIERVLRDLRVHQILEGTNEVMRLIVEPRHAGELRDRNGDSAHARPDCSRSRPPRSSPARRSISTWRSSRRGSASTTRRCSRNGSRATRAASPCRRAWRSRRRCSASSRSGRRATGAGSSARLLIFANWPYTLLVDPAGQQAAGGDAADAANAETRDLIETWGLLHAGRSALGLAATLVPGR